MNSQNFGISTYLKNYKNPTDDVLNKIKDLQELINNKSKWEDSEQNQVILK